MTPFTPLMKQLIGRRALVEGKELQIVDWMENSQTFALQDVHSNIPDFQDSQYGDAGRRVNRVWTLSAFNETRTALHPVIQQFMKAREMQHAQQLMEQT